MGRKRSWQTKPVVGLLLDNSWDPIAWDVWAGADDAVKEQDAHLLCFVGGALDSPLGYAVQENTLYDLVSAETVDGLVVWGGGLGQFVSPDKVKAFCQRYAPLSVVSAALPLEGIPSVLVDNYQGMREVMQHLVEGHGYRRIAFVQGPQGHPEADARFRAYTDVLAELDIPLDPTLVAPGNFYPESGTQAVDLFMNQRGLLPQTHFEAIVAVDDGAAITAIKALQERGIRIPGDVAVVGFDDIEEGNYITPPLTTVPSLVYEQAYRASHMVLQRLAGENVAERVRLSTHVIVRQSCGCEASSVIGAAARVQPGAEATLGTDLSKQRDEIVSKVVKVIQGASDDLASWQAEQFWDAFLTELQDRSTGVFLSMLEESLRRGAGENLSVWQEALSVLRSHTLPYLVEEKALARAEDLWHQARVLIGETALRAQAYRRMQVEYQTRTLSSVSQSLIATFDVAELANTAAEELSNLGIHSAYISLYDDPEAVDKKARLILACTEGCIADLTAESQPFPASQLVPDDILPRDELHSLVLIPLYFQKEVLGFAALEADPHKAMIYDVLGGHISSALKGALLLKEQKQAEAELQRAYEEMEKRVEERTADLKREVAERERAQQQSMRLQQEVIAAQQRAIAELSTPIIPITDRVIVMPLIGSIDSMRARDIMRNLLAGIRQQRAKVVILDITGVPIVDSGVANHLNKTIQAARLLGAKTIITGVSDAVAETIVDLGIDWSEIETLTDLRTGLRSALAWMGLRVVE